MKNNEKVMQYIQSFQIGKLKLPYPAYEVLKPYLSYIRSIWECKRGVACVLQPFLGFSDPKYPFSIKGAYIA